jgi:hypothetical protein
MDKAGARKFYNTALKYMKCNYPDDLEEIKGVTPKTFARMTFPKFLESYCWVVFAARFKVNTVKQKFPAIKRAFHNFNPKKVCSMKLEGTEFPIKNKLKVKSFLNGTRQIRDEGFDYFKARVRARGDYGMEELTCLPFIKGITKKHLARNIGIKSVAKDDIWLVRLKRKFAAREVDELVGFLSKDSGDKQGVVDLVLWQYCADCGCK